jgi:cytochrome c oxidase subunit 3
MSNVAVHTEHTPVAHGEHGTDHAHGHSHGPAHLHHHFTDTAQQRESNALGMWTFLITEVMTFGALFFVYTLYRHTFDVAAFQQGFKSPFAIGSELLDNGLGFINTLVLLVSSLTMAGAVHAAGMKNKKLLVTLLGATWILGFLFLGIKSVEWTNDWKEGLVPGLNWNPGHTLEEYGYELATIEGVNGGGTFEGKLPPPHVIGQPEHLLPNGEPALKGVVNGMQMQMFFCIYFAMAGLHAIHMIIGLGLVAVYIRHARHNIFTASSNDQPVEILGLYWHFVDIVWVFLYPLLYLIAH